MDFLFPNKLVAGVDEAGRGPLAGPVVAAAVILNPDQPIPNLDDSKRLSANKRKALFDLIFSRATSVGVGLVDINEIDRINILNAALKAMRIALEKLSITPEIILVDGNRPVPGLEIEQYPLIKGDSRIPSIMAASIIAKVTRDEIMIQYSRDYPQYRFQRNKGYGTTEHIRALKEHGPSPIHRRSFNPVKELLSLAGNF
ncbi:MAG: ribonuclease HII [candidate division Zixibacteria bacterium CG_4_9_14_3_um_filter_46_8]|nr:MAG: ribonuclease HII [candidate division Zixibacteria bacterium CG_4_9_14_3_um_filter_46_8]